MLKNGISDFAFAFGEAAAEVARQKQLTGDMLNAATSGMAPMEFLNSHTAEVKALEQGNAESEARIKTLQSEISGMKPQQADTTRLDALGNAQVDLYSNAPRPPQQIQPSVTDAEKYALIAAILGGEPIAKVLGEFTRSKQQVVGFQNDQNQQVFNNELQVQRADGQALDSMVDNENRRVGIEQGSNDRNFNAGLDSLNQQIGNEQDGIRSNNQRITAENALAETKRKNLQGEFQKQVSLLMKQFDNDGEIKDDEVQEFNRLVAGAKQAGIDVSMVAPLRAGKTLSRESYEMRLKESGEKRKFEEVTRAWKENIKQGSRTGIVTEEDVKDLDALRESLSKETGIPEWALPLPAVGKSWQAVLADSRFAYQKEQDGIDQKNKEADRNLKASTDLNKAFDDRELKPVQEIAENAQKRYVSAVDDYNKALAVFKQRQVALKQAKSEDERATAQTEYDMANEALNVTRSVSKLRENERNEANRRVKAIEGNRDAWVKSQTPQGASGGEFPLNPLDGTLPPANGEIGNRGGVVNAPKATKAAVKPKPATKKPTSTNKKQITVVKDKSGNQWKKK